MISKNSLLFACSILLIVAMSLLIMFGDKGMADLNMLEKGKNGLVKKNEELIQENLALYRSLERLKNDSDYIENIARQELGVIGKDEVILKIDGENFD